MSLPPPPPPPPPPPEETALTNNTVSAQEVDPDFKNRINNRLRQLEECRALETECQAWQAVVATNVQGPTIALPSSSSTPKVVSDVFETLVEATDSGFLNTNNNDTSRTVVMRPGARARRLQSALTDRALKRIKVCAQQFQEKQQQQHDDTNDNEDLEQYMALFYDKLQELRHYDSLQQRNTNATATQQQQQPGTDLTTTLSRWIKEVDERTFSTEEVYGKYLDLTQWYETLILRPETIQTYGDFLEALVKQQPLFRETEKLEHRKQYSKWLHGLEEYFKEFLLKTIPAFTVEEWTRSALETFTKTWAATGGCPPHWTPIAAETVYAQAPSSANATSPTIDLKDYDSAEDLATKLSPEALKVELTRLGLKCGGTPLARAQRLFLLKTVSLNDLAKKHFAKQQLPTHRFDMARQECLIQSYLDRLKPTLEATWRRTERRQTQTLREREQELEQEVYATAEWEQQKKKLDGVDDDEDTVIYNPKNLPLDWTGNPIPYWQFKLYGLNHYYYCELCGGESYRGRRAFENHFAESRHSSSLRALGIPNTRHFHGVTKLADVQELWKRLQETFQTNQVAQQEEYEDSQGRVLSRKKYEDLARQGLL